MNVFLKKKKVSLILDYDILVTPFTVPRKMKENSYVRFAIDRKSKKVWPKK